MIINNLYQKNEEITVENYLNKFGIKDCEEFINPTGRYIEPPSYYNNMQLAVNTFKWIYLDENSTAYILSDSGDTDGITSAVIMYQYMQMLRPDWDIKILIHEGKERGLQDEKLLNQILEYPRDLLIIPDSGTNDKEQVDLIYEKTDTQVIVLDHHDLVTPIKKGVLINNQISDNMCQKNGSGCLVTHKFLQALDKEFNVKHSALFIDLVALSLVSDSMNMSEQENRTYYHFGLETIDNVHNTFLRKCIEKFINKDSYTQKDLAFNVIPKFNSISKSKDMELKKKLFSAFIGIYNDLDEVLSLCAESHQLQRKTVDEIINNNIDKIKEISSNNLIIFASDEIPRSYSGLVCGKIMTLAGNKPTIVGSIKDGEFIGSLRSPIPLREELNNNELVEWCVGHEEASGIEIKEKNIQPLIDYYNNLNLDYSPHITVLNSYTIKSLPKYLFGLFEPYNALFGKGIDEPRFFIDKISFYPKDVDILGADKRTLKIKLGEISLLIFNCTRQNKIDLGLGYYEDGKFIEKRKSTKLEMSCVGSLNINIWNNKKYNQIIVDNFEIKEYNKSIEDLI
jgi:single-stranded-DNA-specific exonuclease